MSTKKESRISAANDRVQMAGSREAALAVMDDMSTDTLRGIADLNHVSISDEPRRRDLITRILDECAIGLVAGTAPIATVAPESVQYTRDYLSGWNASERGSEGALERADDRNVSHAWYDGYHDNAAGRPKFTYRAWRRNGCDSDCGYVCDGPHREAEAPVTSDQPIDIRICRCCLLLSANGECCAVPCAAQTTTWDIPPNGSVTLGRTTDECGHDLSDERESEAHSEECDNYGFSWRACDLCGDSLGGDRYAATLWLTVESNR